MNAHFEHLARMGDHDAQMALARQQWRRADAETLDAVQAWVVERAIALGQWLAVYPTAALTIVRRWVGCRIRQCDGRNTLLAEISTARPGPLVVRRRDRSVL